MFSQDGSQIFTPFSSSGTPKAAPRSALTPPGADESWFQWIMAHVTEILDGIAFVKYNNTGLHSLLSNLLPPNTTLAELPHQVLVTTFQLNNTNNNWAPITISNLPNDP